MSNTDDYTRLITNKLVLLQAQ